MEFSRQDYWSELPFTSPGDLSNPGIEPKSPALQADSSPAEPLGKPISYKREEGYTETLKRWYRDLEGKINIYRKDLNTCGQEGARAGGKKRDISSGRETREEEQKAGEFPWVKTLERSQDIQRGWRDNFCYARCRTSLPSQSLLWAINVFHYIIVFRRNRWYNQIDPMGHPRRPKLFQVIL